MRRAVATGLVVALATGDIAAALVASREATQSPAAGPRVELSNVRTEDWTELAGQVLKMVYADWKSVGDRPVRRVTAKVVVLGADGKVVFAVEGIVIYAAPAGTVGVSTGEAFSKPTGEGVPLPGVAEATLSAIEITGVSE